MPEFSSGRNSASLYPFFVHLHLSSSHDISYSTEEFDLSVISSKQSHTSFGLNVSPSFIVNMSSGMAGLRCIYPGEKIYNKSRNPIHLLLFKCIFYVLWNKLNVFHFISMRLLSNVTRRSQNLFLFLWS